MGSEMKAPGSKPPPDMASLMMELARIRRDVEGQSEPRKPIGVKFWLTVTAIVAAVVWSMFGGPCSPPGGVP